MKTNSSKDSKPEIQKTETEWKNILSKEEYEVLRNSATERPFSGEYCGLKKDGKYYCKACNNILFDSNTKYNSGTGWPSYYEPATNASISVKEDFSYGMKRMEVICYKCHSHIGHVFEDGPMPTGLRYCINSIALNFVPKNQK